MTKQEATRYAKLQAVMSGGVATINGKKLTGQGGYWYLDDKKVEDIDKEVLDFVEVDELYVNSLITE